jgi:hypothetical protein
MISALASSESFDIASLASWFCRVGLLRISIA